MRKLTLSLLLACAPAGVAFADQPAFVTGRPGQTESPVTVPAHYVQIETQIAGAGRDKEDGVTTDSFSLLQTDLRFGLAQGWDAEVIYSPFESQTTKAGGFKETDSGASDLTVRTRRMLAGADGNGVAIAAIAFVTLPTSRDGFANDRVEGGAILTGAAPLTKSLSFTGTIGAQSVDYGSDRQGEFSAGANLSYAITDKAGAFIEVFGVHDQHSADTAATFDFGATYLTSATTQLDAGVNLGITDSADDAEFFVGWSHRF